MSSDDAVERPANAAGTLLDALQSTGYRGLGYDVIRLLAASAVVLHHSYGAQFDPVLQDPIYRFSRGFIHTGFLAVAIFFSVSGFLVTPGLQRSGSVADFAVKRILRIYPALIVVVLLLTFVIGPFLTSLPLREYLANPATYAYLKNIIPVTIRYLPGVTMRGQPALIDGALWTLHFEVLCYLALAVMSLCGMLRRRWTVLPLLALVLVLNAAIIEAPGAMGFLPERLSTFIGLFVYFLAGVTVFLYADIIPAQIGWSAVILTATIAALGLGIGGYIMPVAIAYVMNRFGVLGFAGRGVLKHDISYGIYILHTPMLVALLCLWPALADWRLIAVIVFALTVPTAYASFRVIEQPALTRKGAVIAWIEARLAALRRARLAWRS